eukprot:79569-Pyramimonas_sp.AAC.1
MFSLRCRVEVEPPKTDAPGCRHFRGVPTIVACEGQLIFGCSVHQPIDLMPSHRATPHFWWILGGGGLRRRRITEEDGVPHP